MKLGRSLMFGACAVLLAACEPADDDQRIVGELGLDGLLAFNRATDWASFNAALDLHAAPAETAGMSPEKRALIEKLLEGPDA